MKIEEVITALRGTDRKARLVGSEVYRPIDELLSFHRSADLLSGEFEIEPELREYWIEVWPAGKPTLWTNPPIVAEGGECIHVREVLP